MEHGDLRLGRATSPAILDAARAPKPAPLVASEAVAASPAWFVVVAGGGVGNNGIGCLDIGYGRLAMSPEPGARPLTFSLSN